MEAVSQRIKKYHLAVVFFISVLCLVIYSNTLNSPFIFDDLLHIKGNSYFQITCLDFQSLYNAAFKNPNSTRPFTNLSFALNYYFGEYNVTGYHAVNILIHIINGILIYFLSINIFGHIYDDPGGRVTKSRSPSIIQMSLFTALLFCVHPVQTQSVAYIDQRMNSMATMFYLVSLLFYIYGRLKQGWIKRCLLFYFCFFSWIMALGSKEIAATLPLIILLYEHYFFQGLRSDWLRKNLKYLLALIVVFGLAAFLFLGTSPIDRLSGYYAIRDFTMLERLLTQSRVVILYISFLFFPVPSRLNFLHFIETSKSLFTPFTTILSILIIIGLIGFAIVKAKKYRLISYCILWFFINLAIESSFIGLEMIYEYRLYLPLFGFALLAGNLFFISLSIKRSWAVVISGIIILLLGASTYTRNRVWQDSITFWSDVISKNPYSHRAYNNLGTELLKQGHLEEAIGHYQKALKIKPNHEKTLNNMGNALDMQGRTEDAVKYYLKALSIRADYEDAHYNLANVMNRLGKNDEALEHYLKVLQINPYHDAAHNRIGDILQSQGRMDEAIKHYKDALRINPDSGDAHNNLGNLLQRQGHIDEAIKHYKEALRIKPDFAEAHNNMGASLFRKGDLDGAINHFQEALRIKPDYVNAKKNLRTSLLVKKKNALMPGDENMAKPNPSDE